MEECGVTQGVSRSWTTTRKNCRAPLSAALRVTGPLLPAMPGMASDHVARPALDWSLYLAPVRPLKVTDVLPALRVEATALNGIAKPVTLMVARLPDLLTSAMRTWR